QLRQASAESAHLHEQMRLTAVHVANLEHHNRAVAAESASHRAYAERLQAEMAAQTGRLEAELAAQAERFQAEMGRSREEMAVQAKHHETLDAQRQIELDRTQTDLDRNEVELRLTHQHADALEQRVAALKKSLSWKLTAPLRGVANLLTLRLSWN